MSAGEIPRKIKHLLRKNAVKCRDHSTKERLPFNNDKVRRSILSHMMQFESMLLKSRDKAVKSFWDSNS